MGRSASRRMREGDGDRSSGGAGGLSRALALTLASALVWGVAHIVAGRRLAGGLLLALYLGLLASAGAAATFFRSDLLHLAVRPELLERLSVALLALGVVWVFVVIRSYQVLRPPRLSAVAHVSGAAAVAVLCFAVAVPGAWSSSGTLDLRASLARSCPRGGPHWL